MGGRDPREAAMEIFRAGLAAADPFRLLKERSRLEGDRLCWEQEPPWELPPAGAAGRVIVLGAGHFQQLARIAEVTVEVVQGDNNAFEGLAFAADFLGACRVIPPCGVFAELDQFFETAGLGIVVKDTSAAPPCAR